MKKFHLTENYALINFDASLCDSEVTIIQSKSFEAVLVQYIKLLRKNKDIIMTELKGIRVQEILDTYKLLLIYDFESVYKKNHELHHLLKKRETLYHLTEKFYDYWRKLERFGLMASSKLYHQTAKTADFIHAADNFNAKILYLYRTISQNLLGHPYDVYRQLPAGVNANILYVPHRFSYNETYANLQNVGFITSVLTRPPFMIYSKSNTRSGLFQEIDHNPLKDLNINKLHYFAYPVKIGPLLAFVYIHRDFLHHGIGLSNLFEVASYEAFKDKKPDILYVYGIREHEYDCTFYHDKEEDLYIGFVSRNDKNDYFGYLKKMLLTLHNVHMIDQKKLPIHGAMVSVILKNNETKNIVVIGDSGAGKSESLEALRVIGKDYIKEMKVVFDDMGTFYYKGAKVYAQGTEIGAFVRLDDLDAGYAYQEMDRAIFLNPDQTNARVILPISYYNFVMQDHKIDLVLYANNYKDENVGLKLFEKPDEALDVFRRGERMAKGTTSEVGIVKSYFANPFGPVQREKITDPLLIAYFEDLFKQGVKVGELYTKLAIPGYEMKGPQEAAKYLLESLTK